MNTREAMLPIGPMRALNTDEERWEAEEYLRAKREEALVWMRTHGVHWRGLPIEESVRDKRHA